MYIWNCLKFWSWEYLAINDYVFCCPIILKFCTEHGSYTAMLCAKFHNDQTTGFDVMGWQILMRFKFRMDEGSFFVGQTLSPMTVFGVVWGWTLLQSATTGRLFHSLLAQPWLLSYFQLSSRDCQWPLENPSHISQSHELTMHCNCKQPKSIFKLANHTVSNISQSETMSHAPLQGSHQYLENQGWCDVSAISSVLIDS